LSAILWRHKSDRESKGDKMLVQLYCDNTLIFTFEGNREEVGVTLKQAAQNLGLSIDDEFELQNRLTVLFLNQGHNDLVYSSGKFRFTLHAGDKSQQNVA
jgi:hypothetical protein